MLRAIRGRLIAGLMALLFVACATVGVVSCLAAQKSMLGTLHNQRNPSARARAARACAADPSDCTCICINSLGAYAAKKPLLFNSQLQISRITRLVACVVKWQ
jgi:hypothetical protein